MEPEEKPEKPKTELKTFSGHIILNFKNGAMRIMKKRPAKVGPFEIPIEMKFNITVPKKAEVLMEADIEVPQTKVNEMVANMI